jgi:hypothetical protein
MINRITLLLFIPFIFLLVTCTEDAADPQSDVVPIDLPSYYGTYLYNDNDCGGSDIQYATISDDGITFFDFLGDNCDDTVSCYAQDSYELTEVTADTFLIVSQDGSYISDGELYLNGDSSITLSYEYNNGPVEYSWDKIKDDIYSFIPVCDQEYESTKDIADMMVYAVTDEGDLIWKNYIHGGIWDLGSSVTPLSDGGYMVYGIFDGINHSGCCYNFKWDVGDIVKLNGEGQVQWRKEIDFGDGGMSSWYNYIGKSLIETSNGDLVFIAPINGRGMNIVMMDSDGNLIWSQNYPDLSFWNYNGEILETEDGDLVVVSGYTARLALLDYYSGSILKEAEYDGLKYPRAIVNVLGDFAFIGNAPYGDDDYEPIYLLKVSNDGDEIWRKIWSDDTTRPRTALDLIVTSDDGYLLFCYSDPHPYATLIKTDSEGNEEWRKKYNDYVGGSQGWIHETDDGGYFMASGYAVTKLDQNGNIEWNAGTGFDKFFNNGMVSGINHNMKKIDGGAVMTGYGSASWE